MQLQVSFLLLLLSSAASAYSAEVSNQLASSSLSDPGKCSFVDSRLSLRLHVEPRKFSLKWTKTFIDSMFCTWLKTFLQPATKSMRSRRKTSKSTLLCKLVQEGRTLDQLASQPMRLLFLQPNRQGCPHRPMLKLCQASTPTLVRLRLLHSLRLWL